MVSNSQKKLILQKKKALKNKRLNKQPNSSKIEKKSTTENKKRVISNVRQLNWKPVPIPDTLGDYEGLYGIEEIDGVAVKLIDGQMKYIVTDDDKVRSEEDAKLNENAIPDGNFEVDASEGEEIEVEEQIEADDGKFEQEQEIEEKLEEEEEEELEKEEKELEEKEKEEEEEEKVESEFDSQDESVKKVERTNKPESKQSKSKITRLISSKEENDEENVPSLPDSFEQSKPEKQLKQSNKEEKLTSNMFNKLSEDTELPTDEAYLPDWSTIPLSPFTLNGLSKLNFTSPTEIQKHTIPIALEGKDLIGKAITGSGKTLAYGIPILEKALANLNSTTPVGIIFTPTRELANQVMKHLKELVKYSPLSDKSIVSLTGGLSILKQERLLSYNPKILVATPGRCLEILEKSTAIATQLASIDFLVMDEADRLLQNGHFEELDKILEILSNYRPNDNNTNKFKNRWQSLVFSATFSKDLFGKLDSSKNDKTDNEKKRKNSEEENRNAEVKEVLHLLGKKLRFKGKPAYIDVNPTEMVASRISEAMMPCSPKDRDLMLYYFLSIFPGSTLVFTNSIDSVKRLAPTLNNLGIPTVSLHSSMIQKQRLRSIERFNKNCQDAVKTKKSSVLIASDVAARGLDVPGIQHVVHYHLPRTADTYIHRSGRTARAGKEGVSVVLCSPAEASGPLRKLRKIVSKKDEIEDLRILPVETDVLDQLKERMFLGAKLAQAEVSSQSVKKEQNWIEKAAEELGVEDLDDFEDDFLKRDRKRKEGKTLDKETSRAMKAELRELLSRPIRRSGRRSYITGGLNNIAELLMKNEGADHIMGYLQQDALSVLKNTKQKKRKL